ncbi:hypothetical protein [Streptomyces eurythermus]
MLRILDARTGESVPAAPARRGLTRIEAHACGPDPTALRVLLTADLLVRALELGGTPVWTSLTAPRDQPELRTAGTRLAIRPFEFSRDLASGLGEAQALHVVRRDSAEAVGEGPVVAVAEVEWVPGAGGGPAAGEDGPAALTALLSDPSALRLALLAVPRGEPARLGPSVGCAVLSGRTRGRNSPARRVSEAACGPVEGHAAAPHMHAGGAWRLPAGGGTRGRTSHARRGRLAACGPVAGHAVAPHMHAGGAWRLPAGGGCAGASRRRVGGGGAFLWLVLLWGVRSRVR